MMEEEVQQAGHSVLRAPPSFVGKLEGVELGGYDSEQVGQ